MNRHEGVLSTMSLARARQRKIQREKVNFSPLCYVRAIDNVDKSPDSKLPGPPGQKKIKPAGRHLHLGTSEN